MAFAFGFQTGNQFIGQFRTGIDQFVIRQIQRELQGKTGNFRRFFRSQSQIIDHRSVKIHCEIGFECKIGRNKPTVLQEVTIKQIIRAGGYALVVRSVDEVKEVIEAFKKERG